MSGDTQTNVVITENAAKWLVIVVLALGVGYAVVKAQLGYDLAQRSDMNYTLAYNHLVNMDAYLAARGVPVEKFGPLPKPEAKGQQP